MRFDLLFDDLSARLAAGLDADAEAVRVENERLRIARLTLADRLRSLRGRSVTMTLRDGEERTLVPLSFGRDWFTGEAQGAEWLVPVASVAVLALTAGQARESLAISSAAGIADRITLPIVLRDLARRRVNVDVVTAAGAWHGTIDRVGSDHLELAAHPFGTPRREANVTGYRVIALGEVVLVRLG